MNKNISISIKHIRIRGRKKDGNVEYLGRDTFSKNGIDISGFLKKFINDFTDEPYKHNKGEYAFLFQNTNVLPEEDQENKENSDIEFYGHVYAGDSGFSSKLKNMISGDESEKTMNQAELVPFFFTVLESSDSKSLNFVTQKLNARGVKKIFFDALRREFHKVYPNYYMDVISVMPDAYQKEFQEGVIKEVEYTYVVPVKRAVASLEVFGVRAMKDDKVIMKFSVHPQRSAYFVGKNLKDNIFDSIKPKIPGLNVEGSSIKDASVSYQNSDGKLRKLYMIKENNSVPSIIITHKIENYENGHPAATEVYSAIKDVLTENKLLNE